jgi:hypothetical protein
MATRKIERDRWAHFFADFERQHKGRVVALSFFGPGSGSHEDPHTLHLERIALQDAGTEQERVSVQLGVEPHAVVTRAVELPVQVWLKAGDDDIDEVLEIRSDHGQVILLRFRFTQEIV